MPPFGSGNDFGALSAFLQNLQNLNSLTALNLASGLLFNFNLGGGTDNKIAIGLVVPGPSGAVAVGTPASPFYVAFSSPPITTPIKKATVYTLGSPLTNQASPVTIINQNYTPAASTSLLLIMAGSTVANHVAGASSVDVGLFVANTLYTSSRSYQNADVGSTTLYTNYQLTSSAVINIKLKATSVTGVSNLDISTASVTIIEF